MKALVVTVAGMSSRFSESVGQPTLKCVYSEGAVEGEDDTDDIGELTLIGRLLQQTADSFDCIVIVGGFKFDELKAYLERYFPKLLRDKVQLVYNDRFADFGSGWSLYLGLQALKDEPVDSVLFVEGDLYISGTSMKRLCSAEGDVITFTVEPVEADKSVAIYEDALGYVHYIYDTAHGMLSVPEPFRWILSSGQIWRFGDAQRLFKIVDDLPSCTFEGTNLELVNPYYSPLPVGQIEMIELKNWVNCNTIDDYRRAFAQKGNGYEY